MITHSLQEHWLLLLQEAQMISLAGTRKCFGQSNPIVSGLSPRKGPCGSTVLQPRVLQPPDVCWLAGWHSFMP